MQAAAGSELSSLKGKSKGKDIFLKFHVSTNRSVYQQGVVEANEKNYLIRAIHRQRQGPRVSVSSSGKAIHQSLSLSFLPSKESVQTLCLRLRNAHAGGLQGIRGFLGTQESE